MGDKSLPSGQSKKTGKSLKEKRDAKRVKRESQEKHRKGWTQDR